MNADYSGLSRALVARMFEGAALTDFSCLDQSFQRILQRSSGDFLTDPLMYLTDAPLPVYLQIPKYQFA